jgi:uncharacterized protein
MNTIIRFLFIFTCISFISSCASVHSTNFYTLNKPLSTLANSEETTQSLKNASMIQVSVNVPDGLKRPQIVINHKDGSRILVLEHDRWLSAFDEELKDALTSGIHASQKDQSLLANNRYLISVNLLQMDTFIADKVTADFHWKITRQDNASQATNPYILNCQFTANQPIKNSVQGAVEGIKAIVQDVINLISQQIQTMDSTPVKDCS